MSIIRTLSVAGAALWLAAAGLKLAIPSTPKTNPAGSQTATVFPAAKAAILAPTVAAPAVTASPVAVVAPQPPAFTFPGVPEAPAPQPAKPAPSSAAPGKRHVPTPANARVMDRSAASKPLSMAQAQAQLEREMQRVTDESRRLRTEQAAREAQMGNPPPRPPRQNSDAAVKNFLD